MFKSLEFIEKLDNKSKIIVMDLMSRTFPKLIDALLNEKEVTITKEEMSDIKDLIYTNANQEQLAELQQMQASNGAV